MHVGHSLFDCMIVIMHESKNQKIGFIVCVVLGLFPMVYAHAMASRLDFKLSTWIELLFHSKEVDGFLGQGPKLYNYTSPL